MRFPRCSRALLVASSLLAASSFVPVIGSSLVTIAHAEDQLSAKVGKPLQEAQTALGAKNYAKAMSAVNAADAIPGKTEYEKYTIAQMRAAVAASSGDVAAASKAYDVLIASPRTPAAAKQQMLMANATMAYNARDYAHAVPAIERYLKIAGPNAQMQTLLVQSYYLQQDYKNAARVQQDQINDEIKAKRIPPENQLQFLATCYHQMKDSANETHAYVLLAKYYSKPDYWAMLIHNLAADPQMPDALQFNLERLRMTTGVLKDPSDYMDMVERAVQAGLPQLGLNLMNQAYASGALGKDQGAAREARLKAMVVKRAADTKATLAADAEAARKMPNAAPSLTAGYNLVLNGQVDEGLALMREGLAKKPIAPEGAKLQYAMAQMDGGRKAEAVKSFADVHGDHGSQDLAQLWTLLLTKSSK
ncbi:hypothetical protein [Asaia bogorensis]|uniref:hypothetical protein n=1 Tax=Asaia bogorensis TaxID=91915 RepID=UPI0028546285|nr:hypothetical protein [Asaia bogorensis]MDR6183632.1 hypothetical protein [Asaia bogorensis NBRC 16594]